MGRGSQGLHANVLLDTVYEPLPTWSLVKLCAATFVCPDSRMKLLACLLQRRKVYDYEQLTIMMSSIAYNDRALDFRCRPLGLPFNRIVDAGTRMSYAWRTSGNLHKIIGPQQDRVSHRQRKQETLANRLQGLDAIWDQTSVAQVFFSRLPILSNLF